MICSRVLLPAPFGPSSAQCSPARMVTLTWSSSSRSSRTRSTRAAWNTMPGSAATFGAAMGPDRTGRLLHRHAGHSAVTGELRPRRRPGSVAGQLAGKHARMASDQNLLTPPPPSAPARRREPLQPGPLVGRYGPTAVMVILFLIPYLGLSAAVQPLAPIIAAQLHASPQTLSLGAGLANAGYAVGTVLAVQLAQLLPQRRLLIAYAAALVIGSVLAAAATGPVMFIVGHVVQGLCTSMLLIAAAPPLFLGFPTARLRWTAVIFNLCIFGAIAAGPLIGGAQASFHAWRPLFWIVAGIAAGGLVMSLLTFQDAPPADRSAPRDWAAISLAAVGSVAAFSGASELLTHGFADPAVIVPLLVGLFLIVVLWVYEYRASRPLLTVRMLASTIPVTGVVVAVCAAAAATSAVGLTATVLGPHYTPLHLGLLYIPELVAAIVTAFVFGAV